MMTDDLDFMHQSALLENARRARTYLDAIIQTNDAASYAFRDMLTCLDDAHFDFDEFINNPYYPDADLDTLRTIWSELHAVAAADYQTDWFSRKALDDSLCPMHFCDYHACFEDDDPECAQIRAIFPSHDT